MNIHEFEAAIGVHFEDSNLLLQALTHRSYVHEHAESGVQDNERMEFLGDAILDFITGEMLYHRFPEMSEGLLTRLRSALVRTDSLAKLAAECGIGEAMRIGKGEEQVGGRTRKKILCQVFEAVVGAMYLDQGLEVVAAFVVPRLTALQKHVMEEAVRKDARSQLQEWSQAHFNLTPQYRVVAASGPEHDKEFSVEVLIGEDVIASGMGRTKQTAAQTAARNALAVLENRQVEIIVPNQPAPQPSVYFEYDDEQ